MKGFLFIAATELLPALIIWWFIKRFALPDKGKRRLLSVGFVVVWAVLIVADFSYRSAPTQQLASATPGPVTATEGEVAANDAATFAANKPELLAIAKQVALGGAVDQQTHDHFWSLIPPPIGGYA
jgi:hypothetical protein